MPADRKCPECGYLNEGEAAFCGNCGSPLKVARPQAPPPSTLPEEIRPIAARADIPLREPGVEQSVHQSPVECPSCHCLAEEEDIFCRRCGARLVQRTLYCKRCGDPVDPDESFCNRCGLPLR
jgi:uncharacterized membrane protein YvbJ